MWDEVNTSLALRHPFIVLFTWKTTLILHEQATSPALPSTCELVCARAFEVCTVLLLEAPCSPEVIICGSPRALRSRTTHALCLSLPSSSPLLSCQNYLTSSEWGQATSSGVLGDLTHQLPPTEASTLVLSIIFCVCFSASTASTLHSPHPGPILSSSKDLFRHYIANLYSPVSFWSLVSTSVEKTPSTPLFL